MISVIIPTLDRGEKDYSIVWLMNSLSDQSVPPDEVLVCIDNDGENTAAFLRTYRKFNRKFVIRMFRRTAPKAIEGGGPGLAEQILFANVKGDIIIHVDSDGYLNRKMIEFVVSQKINEPPYKCLWGRNIFYDECTGFPLEQEDGRLADYPSIPGIYPMNRLDAHGALWAVPTKIIRDIGGHAIVGIDWRGQDSRLGQRIQSFCQCCFVTLHPFCFNHFGIPTQHRLLHPQGISKYDRFLEAQEIKKFKQTHHLPQLGWFDMLIANGGENFWSSGALDSMYVEIKD